MHAPALSMKHVYFSPLPNDDSPFLFLEKKGLEVSTASENDASEASGRVIPMICLSSVIAISGTA